MKRILRMVWVLAAMVALVLVGAGGALAQTPSPNLEVKGIISAIDKAAVPPTVSIAPKDGVPVPVKVTADTIITKAGLGKVTINELAKDDRAVATYNKDTLVASKISVSSPLAKHHSFVGTANITSNSSFVVTTKKQGNVTISVNAQTKYKVPGVKNATLANFKTGDRVAVLAVEAGGGYLALHVNLIPGKPVTVQRVGTVEAYSPGTSITIKGKKGDTSTFVVTSDTKIRLKSGATEVAKGERVTVVARRDPASDQFTAREILVFGSKKR